MGLTCLLKNFPTSRNGIRAQSFLSQRPTTVNKSSMTDHRKAVFHVILHFVLFMHFALTLHLHSLVFR
eukprot:1202392-Amphidinium_carterae.1